ncbi:MAG: hypothetical protein WDM91_15620 [Rhizomicrobium sp.]
MLFMGVVDDEGNIKQPSPIWDMGVVLIAATLTFCGLAMCFFTFTVSGDKAVARQPAEVTIGVGDGSTIHPDAQPVNSNLRPVPAGKPQEQP